MPQKGLDPLQEGLPTAVHDVVMDLRTVYTDGPFDRLRAVEAAIDAARAEGADLVTVSSATCSRMLGPRRTAEGRTALPRWPSVRTFLAVHDVDPAPYEERWSRARSEWASAEEPAEPVDVVDITPDRRGGLRRLLPLLLGLLIFAAGTGVGVVFGRQTVDPSAGVAAEGASVAAVSPAALPDADAVAGPTGVNCALGGTGGGVRFLSVAAEDGLAGVSQSIRVDLEVVVPVAPGHSYWLMLRLFTEGMPFFAKAQVRGDSGPGSYVLRFDSPIGSVRDLFVVDADEGAGQWLRESFDADVAGDSTWDQKRGSLPPGSSTVSGTCRVERTR